MKRRSFLKLAASASVAGASLWENLAHAATDKGSLLSVIDNGLPKPDKPRHVAVIGAGKSTDHQEE